MLTHQTLEMTQNVTRGVSASGAQLCVVAAVAQRPEAKKLGASCLFNIERYHMWKSGLDHFPFLKGQLHTQTSVTFWYIL